MIAQRAVLKPADTHLAMVATGPIAAAVLGPLLPLLIVFSATVPAGSPPIDKRLASVVAATLAVAVAISFCGLLTGRLRQFPASLWMPTFVLVGSQFLALALAIDPLGGLFSIVCTLAGVVVLIACVESLSVPSLRRLFLSCYFASAIVAAGFAIVLSIMRVPPAMFAYEHGRASGTFLQPNEFAGYLLFVIPLGLAQIAAPVWLRAIGLAAALTGTLGLLLSVSRAAIVSLFVTLPIFMRRFGRRAVAVYGTAAVIVVFVLLAVFRNVAHDPSENASRIAVWGSSLRLVERFALTGVGPFGFHRAYPALKLPRATVDEMHAHDVPLHILVEDGIIGLGGLLWFVVCAYRAAAQTGRAIPPHDRERRLLFAALCTGFAASALQNLVDVVTTFLLVVAWPMLGLLLSLGFQEEAPA